MSCRPALASLGAAFLLAVPPEFVSASEITGPGSGGKAHAEAGSSSLGSLGKTVLEDTAYLATSPLRLDAKGALVLGGTAAAIGGLMLLDDDIQNVFQKNRGRTLDDIGDALTSLGSGPVLAAANLGLIGTGWWFREDKAGDKLMRTSAVALEAQVFAEGLTGLTKLAVGRNRPSAGRGDDSFEPFHGLDRSFPSSHAARAFAVATVFADRYEQPVPLIAYSAATLIGLSRIYLNEHFASDVVAGAALGFALGKVLSLRHTLQGDGPGLSLLPYLPEAQGGLGLTIQYTFR